MSFTNLILGILLIIGSIPILGYSTKSFKEESLGFGGGVKLFFGGILLAVGITLVVREFVR